MAKRDARGRRRADDEQAIRDQVESPALARPPVTFGAEAADRWLRSLDLPSISRWHAEIAMSGGADTTFELNIYAEEWGFAFQHDSRMSWIRVTDIPFVHGRDELELLPRTPDLLAINLLATELENEHGVTLQRQDAIIRTNIPDATEIIREWLVQPLPYSTVKKTVELCSDEMHRGIRCTKSKGHDGDHEYVAGDARGQLRWR